MTALIRDRVIHSPFSDFDVGDSHASQIIEECLIKFSSKVIAVDAQQSLTAIELLTKIRRYAAGYREHGLKPGSRVCTHIRNTLENVAAALGVVFAGGTLVMAKTSYVARELMYTVRDSDCQFILADEETAHNVLKIEMPSSIKELFSVGSAPGFINVLQFQECPENNFTFYVPVDTEREVVAMLYTSGTTGLPKAVEISHRAYASCYRAFLAAGIFTEEDVVLAWNPFTHISGLMVDTLSMCMGAKIIVIEPSIVYKQFVETLEAYQVSVFLGIPDRVLELINEAKTSDRPAVRVKKIIMAGTRMAKSLGTEICEFFGLESFLSFYGLTETCGFVSCTPVGIITMDNVGFPCAGSKVKVIDPESGESLGPYEKGEIAVQSSNIMKGYHGSPEATLDVLSSDGWLRTGDFGYYDNNGQIYIVDRLKQMIKCMGNVVTPAELEEILMTHEAVLEVAVVGIPSLKYGEAPAACVVVREGKEWPLERLEAELKELIAGQTSVQKHLYGGVVIMKSLPKFDNGKIKRAELKARVAGAGAV